MVRLCLIVVAASLSCLAAPAFAQIERSVQAHGALTKWQSYGGVEYDLASENRRGTKSDHHLFNLRSRDGLITADEYTLGASKGEVWIKPGLEALGGTPPRFYMWTPFYFFAMPFVFADPGATHESLGKKTFQEQEYDAVRITFKAGTGDSPDDFYVAYIDPSSGLLKLASYAWKNENIEGEPLGKMNFSNVRFSTAAPDDSKFKKPADAVAAPLQ